MRVGIVGAGLQGRRRAQALKAVGDSELVIVADVNLDAAAALAAHAGCLATSGWDDVLAHDDVEAVVVCTPPHLHADIAIAVAGVELLDIRIRAALAAASICRNSRRDRLMDYDSGIRVVGWMRDSDQLFIPARRRTQYPLGIFRCS